MPITPQQVEFVKHFTAQGFVDAPLAYRRAYAKAANWTDPAVRSAAAETLEKPRVAYEINKARRAAALAIGDIARKYAATKENIIARFAAIAFTTVGDVASWDPSGELALADLSEDEHVRAAISKVRWTIYRGKKRLTGFELHDPQQALMTLAKLLRLLEDETYVPGTIADPVSQDVKDQARKTFIDALNRMERQMQRQRLVEFDPADAEPIKAKKDPGASETPGS